MKSRIIKVLLLGTYSLMGTVFSDIQVYDRAPVTFGAVIRLKHFNTNKYLTGTSDSYNHPSSSGQKAVYGGTDFETNAASWTIKGKHNGSRWNFDLNANINNRSAIGWPVLLNQTIRLENVATGCNLHSHNAPSPQTGQSEVTLYGSNGVGDTNDDWVVAAVQRESGSQLEGGYRIKLKHINSGRRLHSHGIDWQPGRQEITAFEGEDDNDWFALEIVNEPNTNANIQTEFQASRNVQLSYWTPLFWDSSTARCENLSADRRVWTHGGSRHDGGNNPPPHDHLELLLGPWSDGRAQSGPSFFIIHNADDKLKTGPIQFGDRIKIMAVCGGPGETDKAGLLLPFRYLWLHTDSRHGGVYKEIVISRPGHSSTQGNQAIFVLEPVISNQTGPISSMDLVRIRAWENRYLWTYSDSRWGNSYHEILADKGNEDRWGIDNLGTVRRTLFEKFRFSPALSNTIVNNQQNQKDLDTVNKEIEGVLGAEKAKVVQAHLDEIAKQNAEQAKIIADQKLAAEKAEADRLKAAADTDVAKHERDQALKALDDAKQAAEAAKQQAEKDAQQKLNDVQMRAKADADKAALLAADLMKKLDLPMGFEIIPGKQVKSIALGLQDHKIDKELTFDDFVVIVLQNGSIGQYKFGSDPSNPWQHVPLTDANNAAIKVVAASVATDGTTYVVSQDGKLYGISWPDDTPAAMPHASKGFEASDKKAEQRKDAKAAKASKVKASTGKKKHKVKKSKKGAAPETTAATTPVDEKHAVVDDTTHKKTKKPKKNKKSKTAVNG